MRTYFNNILNDFIDSNKSKYWNKRQPTSPRGGTMGSYCNSPPRKTRKDYSNGKRFPNHRPPIFQERDFNEMAYLEKEVEMCYM